MKLVEIENELVVDDIEKSLMFYETIFGYKLIDSCGEPIVWAKIKKDNCTMMLQSYKEICNEINNYPKKTNTSNIIMFRFDNKNKLLELYNEIKENKINIFLEYNETEYGNIEFGILDPDNNRIIISG